MTDEAVATESIEQTEESPDTTIADSVPAELEEEVLATNDDERGDQGEEKSSDDEPSVDAEQEGAGEETQEQVPALSSEDLARARQVGLPEQLIASFKGDPAAMDLAIGYLDRARQQSTASPQAAQPPAQTAPPAKVPDKYELKLSEYLADDVREPLEKMNEHYAQQMAQQRAVQEQIVGALLTQVAPMLQVVQQHQTDLQLERLDNFIGSLGDEWQDVFGQGPTTELAPNCEEVTARLKLVDAVAAIHSGRASTGANPGSMSKLLRSAFNQVFGETQAKKMVGVEKKKIADQVKRSGRTIINKPNAVRKRADEKPFGPDRAMAGLTAKFPNKFDDERE